MPFNQCNGGAIGGLDKNTNAAITKALCGLLQKELSIPPDKVCLNFTDVPASNWGWKGSAFG
ncbi:MAG: phenylpyruvate tautomerase MIF-related protein [Verrucomicrobiota bacterium]|nr:phenylpyruvate tautomerase MIF-related protein [Verrucomicrobiota bacterium]